MLEFLFALEVVHGAAERMQRNDLRTLQKV